MIEKSKQKLNHLMPISLVLLKKLSKSIPLTNHAHKPHKYEGIAFAYLQFHVTFQYLEFHLTFQKHNKKNISAYFIITN